MTIALDYAELPPPTVRAALIAARVPELQRGLMQDLAIASDQSMPKPTLRQRVAAKLKSMIVADAPATGAYDTAGYYPVRRS